MSASTPSERRAALEGAARHCHEAAIGHDNAWIARWAALSGAFQALADAEDCEQVENDRDELSATVERLYDGIDAALNALTSPSYGESQHAAATRILRDLRTTEITAEVPERAPDAIMVDEGWWWHPDVQDGQVHLHTDRQPSTMHRLCAPVYTRRTP